MRRARRAWWATGVTLVLATMTGCAAPVGPATDAGPPATAAAVTAAPGPSAPDPSAPDPSGPTTTSAAPTSTVTVAPTAATASVFSPAGAAAITAGQTGVSWLSWSLVDRTSGARTGSTNAATERTNAESSIKAWLATDYLRALAARRAKVPNSGTAQISAAIRRSDDNAAESLYRAAGGDRTLADLAPVCGVAASTSRRGYWSFAQITAQDATAILDCVLRRAPTYPGGTALLQDLRSVGVADRFGIPEALPPGTEVAVKNGWTQHGGTGLWNVNCVAAWSHYTLAVMTRYRANESLDVGAHACADVTRKVLATLP